MPACHPHPRSPGDFALHEILGVLEQIRDAVVPAPVDQDQLVDGRAEG